MCFGKICLKLCSMFFIILFSLISIAEILCGTYILVYMCKINRPETLSQQYLVIPSLSLILFGIALLPLIVLGCCSFCKEVACCANLYSSILLVLSILQILVGIFTIITFIKTNDDLVEQIKEDFTFSLAHYKKNPIFVNTVQKEMHCCGKNSSIDWANVLPSSCCGYHEVKCNEQSSHLYKNGCVGALTDFILFWNSIIGYASVAIGTIEILATILGFCLGCGTFRYYYKV